MFTEILIIGVVNKCVVIMDIHEETLKIARNLIEKDPSLTDWVISKFPELKESEDERMVKFIKNQLFNIKKTITENYELDAKLTNAIDWLEKQGEHANFCNKIQIGDKVTRNEDGVLVNLSQLNRVAKKQGEQKPDSGSFWEGYNTAKEKLKHKPWSEEDEKILNLIIARLHSHPNVEVEEYGKDYHWLNSLRERYTWKPSEGQLECLGYAIDKAEKDWSPLTNNRIYLTLKALKEQLLELRGSKV